MVTALAGLEDGVLGKAYTYDQLNRIKKAESFTDYSLSTNAWGTSTADQRWYTEYSYDANGNILSLKRRADSSIYMDDLSYHYQSGTNKLTYVDDAVAESTYANDIDDQSSGNYAYDEIGNLIQDLSEEIASIEWTVYGKIKSITRTTGSKKPSLGFDYTPDGHRLAKHVTDSLGHTTSTWYIRDPTGNVMATYQKSWLLHLDTSQLDLAELYDALKEDLPHNSVLAFLHEGLNWYEHADTLSNFSNLHSYINSGNLERDFLDHFSTTDFLSGALFDSVYARMSPAQIASYLRSYGYTDADLVDAICGECIDSLLASMMRKDYTGFLNNLHSTNQTAFDDLCTQLSVPGMLPLNDKITMIISSSNPANSAGILSNGGHLQCSEILSIFDWMFVLESSLSNNQLDSVNGVKACYKGALGEAELAAAMEHTLGYNGMWDRIFAEEPGTEDEYIHHIRQNQSALFLYHALLVLNDYGYLDNIAYNLNGVYIGPWLDAVKSHFGEGYYNTYITKLLPGNYTSSWAYKLNEQHIYGSSRIGLIQRDLPLIKQKYGDQAWNYITTENDTAFVYHYTTDSIKYRNRGEKRYELSNHLGNVLAVITDRRIQACETGELMHYEAQIVQVTDYYPFGSIVESRSWKGDYRYGFNGVESTNEISNNGNHYEFKFREYNPRNGKFWSVDPLFKEYPWNSTFAFAENIVIWAKDLEGLEAYRTNDGEELGKVGNSNEVREIKVSNDENSLSRDEQIGNLRDMISKANDANSNVSETAKANLFYTSKPAEDAQSGEGAPQWMGDVNSGVGVFGLANGAKTELIDHTIRSNYKSAQTWSEFNKLRPTQQAWRRTNTLGKTGASYLKHAKGLGYVGAGLTTAYSVTNAYNYFNNGGTDWQVYTKSVLDVTMTGVGFLGPIGFGVSASYFILDASTGGFGGFGQIKP